MNKFNWSKVMPHLIAIAVFLVVALIYCKPALQGKVLQQSDIIHWKGMAQNSFTYKETHGHFPLWTNGMFSGMPAYQIAMDPNNPFNLIYIHSVLSLFLGKPFQFFFLLCLGFYFLSQVYKADYRIGIAGALAYAYSSFSPILVVAGHESQVLVMAYMPALLGAVLLVYQKKYWVGAALTALFTSLFIALNHLQVTYYFLIVACFMTLYYVMQWIRAKEYKHLIKSLVIVGITGIIGVASNMVILATTYDFSKATMRNGVLDLDSNNTATKTTGLPVDYAFQWSFEKPEVLSILVPNIYGGVSGGDNGLDKNSHFAKLATQSGVPEDQAAQLASQMPTYWGEQPFTSGPVYLGAIICFLFVFGMIYLRRKDKWWMLAVSVLAIMMSWGRFFPELNNFLFNYLPMYNKFRVPTYTLIIPQLIFPLLSVVTLQQLFFAEKDKAYTWKKLKISGYVTAGAFLVIAMLYSSFTYESSTDSSTVNYLSQLTGGNKDVANNFYNALKQDRQSLFGSDIMRSLIFAALAFAFVWLYIKDKLKAPYAMLAILLLSSIDILAVGRRYLNDNKFQTKEDQQAQSFTPSAVDQQILQDTGYYRVLNISASDPFQDAMTSYFHNSVGGYNPAKLAIYQDLITYQLNGKLNINVLNMLNTKYVINRGQQGAEAQVNPGNLGACWFTKQVAYVKDDAAAMRALDKNNPADSAIIEEAEKSKIAFAPSFDSTASIHLIKNDNDVITYSSKSNTNQFAVFSEIYYDRGWKAYVDDKETPIVRTDYVLRGLAVPAGAHNIRFEFKPASFYNSLIVAIIASAIVWLLLAITAFLYFRNKPKQTI
ncbi:YfhO family protein [Parafilimonas sp.]|uniref:YfhO family protein n=1 Tax=Parafilimonas sp. TaxID=1969739 RepID=UPI0039E5C23E